MDVSGEVADLMVKESIQITFFGAPSFWALAGAA